MSRLWGSIAESGFTEGVWYEKSLYWPIYIPSVLDVCFSMVSFRKGVILSLSHTHIGVPWGFNFSFSTSIPISVIGESPQGTILGERLSEMVLIKNFNFFKMEIPIINF